MSHKPFLCPNCNGTGPFVVLRAVDKVDRMGVPTQESPIPPFQVFYMCVSDGEDHNCRSVNTLEELTS